jgi:hypothetical protein
MRHERMEGIPSKHRDDSVEENLRHFDEMKAGTSEGLRWCIRAKISVDNPNKALRDPVIYRCNIAKHHRTGCAFLVLVKIPMSNTVSSAGIVGKYTRHMTLLVQLLIQLKVLRTLLGRTSIVIGILNISG